MHGEDEDNVEIEEMTAAEAVEEKWRKIVECGADTNATDNNDNTPLDLAGEKNHKEIAQYLSLMKVKDNSIVIKYEIDNDESSMQIKENDNHDKSKSSIQDSKKLSNNEAKHFDIRIYKDDLANFWQNKDTFIQEYINKNPTLYLSKDDIYSLLLNTAIVFKNKEIIQYILNHKDLKHSENILTHVDESNYSPISNTLDSGDTEMLDLIKAYIESNKDSIVQVNKIDEEDYANILTTIKYPQFEELDAQSYYENYLKHLYSENALNEMYAPSSKLQGSVEQANERVSERK